MRKVTNAAAKENSTPRQKTNKQSRKPQPLSLFVLLTSYLAPPHPYQIPAEMTGARIETTLLHHTLAAWGRGGPSA